MKSQERLKKEALLIKFKATRKKPFRNEIFNPETKNWIVDTLQNIRRVYDIIYRRESRKIKAGLKKTIDSRKAKEKILRKQLRKAIRTIEEKKVQQETLKEYIDLEALIATGKQYLVNVILNNGLTEAFTLNANTIDEINKLLNRGYIEDVENEYKSDSIHRAFYEGIKSYTITEIVAKKKIKNKSGSFFNYENQTNLDLSGLQIFQEFDDEKYIQKILKHQCLLYVLKLNGVKKSLINTIKLSVGTRAIPKKDLNKICDIIKKKIIIHFYRNKEEKHTATETHGKDYDDVINVSLYEEHYFLYEETKYSKFFIDNYEALKDKKNGEKITRTTIKNGKQYLEYSDKKKCNTLYLVNKLFNAGYFKKNTLMLLKQDNNANYKASNIPLDNIHNEQKRCDSMTLRDEKNESRKPLKIFYGDTETITGDEDEENKHSFYKLGLIDEIENEPKIYTLGENWIHKMFDYVKKRTPSTHKAVCFFHNLKYDFNASFKKNVFCENLLRKDGSVYRVNIKYNGFVIELRDSFKLINKPLKDFSKTFKLSKDLTKKEAIEYTFYKKETLESNIHSVKEYIKKFNEEKKYIFYEAMNTGNFKYNKDNETFDANLYYNYYLRYDVKILKAGMMKLREMMNKISKMCSENEDKEEMDLFNYLTISSFGHAIMSENGAYDDIYQVSGNLREFISRAINGGRVNILESVICKEINEILNDLDATSLYPSAMDRLTNEMGLPKGEAKNIENEDYKDKKYYIIEIKLLKINKKQMNPFIAIRRKNKIDYVNTINEPEIITVDKITLEDYIKFHQIEYEFIKGVYWDNGANPKMGGIVNILFNERKRYKNMKTDEGDILQELIKLILNSLYGKTITTKSKRTTKIINKNIYDKKNDIWSSDNEGLNNYICSNFNNIIKYTELNDKQVIIEEYKTDFSYNLGHIGCLVLSYSKRIMNEVMGLASDNKINIYYQDTDSLIMRNEDIPILTKLYKNEYDKDLIGGELGQFKSDYNLKGAVGEIVATKALFLGKKSYICMLEGKNKNGEVVKGTHHRMKGITAEGIDDYTNKIGKGEVYNLYSRLAEGENIKIVLNPSCKKIFDYDKKQDISIMKTGKFKRDLCFNEETRKIIKEIKKQEKIRNKNNYKNAVSLDGESI